MPQPRPLVRRIVLCASALAAIGLLAAPAHAQVKFGAVLSLTGASASVGEDQRRGMLIAIDDINASGGVLGQPVQLIIEDTGGRAVSALEAAKKLVNVDKVAAVFGEYSSSLTIPVGQYVVKQGLPFINHGSSSPAVRSIGDGGFSVIGLDTASAQFAAKDLWDQGARKVAFIAPNNAYGQGIAPEFQKNFEALGGQVVSLVLYTAGQSTYRRELQQMERAKPDAYVYSAYGQEAAVINREAFDLGMNKPKPWYAIYHTMCTTDSAPAHVEGQQGMDVNAVGPQGKGFQTAYETRYGHGFKSSYTGYAYDGVRMAAAAVQRAGNTQPDAVKQALRAVGQNYEGATGAIQFAADGQRGVQPYMKTKYSGKIVPR
ncbi:amino acid ABC transporter [Rhodococcus sp. SRB_17]|nr:amino acid ABC transporter [Rhodococcus sp. SRB_17]